MEFAAWHIWVLAGIAALALEMMTPDMIVGSIGLACFAAAAAAFSGGGIQPQLVTFIVATVLIMFAVRPVVKRVMYCGSDDRPIGIQALVGKQGVVEDRIGGGTEPGRVKLGGEEWRALSDSRQAIEEGSRVIVVRVDGTSVTVRPEQSSGA